jgi:hypothetical protein
MDAEQKKAMEQKDLSSSAILLEQGRSESLFKVFGRLIAPNGNAVKYGPVDFLSATTAEAVRDLYKDLHPDCKGTNLVGTWETICKVEDN